MNKEEQLKKFREKSRKYNKKIKDKGIYSIYYLPEEHYIGVTNYPARRISNHKWRGLIVEGWEIVAEYKDPKLAALHEALLHFIGYNGSHYDKVLNTKRNYKLK